MHETLNAVLDPGGMRERRDAYFRFARSQAPRLFKPDGSYQPTTEPDGRIAYWILPAFLASTDEAERAFGLRVYAAGAGWNGYDVFMTSCTAAHLVRHGAALTPELRRRSEEHLARFTVADGGRRPSAGIYDYQFHGYNDNMPAMATRTMLFAGQALGRRDFTDVGLFHLEGLCAHFHRRGLLSEHTSATYTPITLCSLLDVSEACTHPEAREMAQACADRILVDVLGHWHWETGTTGGTMSRAYTVDCTETLSILNAYLWYISGHPMTISPAEALGGDAYDAPMHHGRNRAFNIAQFVEVMGASHDGVNPRLREFARAPRRRPYEIRATADWAEMGPHGGSRDVQTRSHQHPQWWLATSSSNNTGGVAGQTLVLHGAFAAVPEPRTWRDRIAFWPRLVADHPDHGDPERPGVSPHAGALKGEGTAAEPGPYAPDAESDHVTDWGRYQTVQKGGSALLLGAIGPDLDGEDVARLRFGMYFTTWRRRPDEVFESDLALAEWSGEAAPKSWQFLRFGAVYLGLRFTGMVHGRPAPVRRAWAHRYLKLEMPLLDGEPMRIAPDLRAWTEFGCLVEMGSEADSGSFAEFRRAVLATTWEYHHNFYRSSRFVSRNGELQIVDSVLVGTARFIAVDGEVEPVTMLEATGLAPALTRLFPDGRRIRQRRLSYRNDCIVGPYVNRAGQILEADIPDGLEMGGGR